MHALRTAILEHTTPTGVHHDWLIEDPRLPNPKAPHARLWTARVLPPPSQWAQLSRFTLEVIPPHRRAYLTYQGLVSNNRGRVRRITQGWCLPHLWSAGRIHLTLHHPTHPTTLHLQQLTNTRWLALASDHL